GGPFAPYSQSERDELYFAAFQNLRAAGLIYRCVCSRQDVLRALQAPHSAEDEPIYPGTCRNKSPSGGNDQPTRFNWRFRVPDGEVISFVDGRFGPQEFVAGEA